MDSTYFSEQKIFDDINGDFIARLREIHSNTRSTTDGKATITFKTARIEANYSPKIIKNIEAGRLIAIPNVMGLGTKDTYSIYEVTDIYPMHYSMLTLDRNQPSDNKKRVHDIDRARLGDWHKEYLDRDRRRSDWIHHD